jgi:arabinofuranan 3-O-arabinosyltransferase
LPGDIEATASAALDGNPATAWSPEMGVNNQRGAWIQVNRPQSSSVDHLDLVVVADGRHSVPTRLRVQACDHLAADGRCPSGSRSVSVAVPAVTDGTRPGNTVSVPVQFPAVAGRDLTVTVTGVRLESTPDYSFLDRPGSTISLPIAIAELGIPGTRIAPPPASMPATCRSNLLTVDGRPVPVKVTGPAQGALAGGGLSVTPCGADASGITLGAGSHVVLSAPGSVTGLDIDQLALDSAPCGGAAHDDAGTGGTAQLPAPTPGPAPTVKVVSSTTTKLDLRITGATRPYWLVLGQSINKGWEATVAGSGQKLGHSTLIDGFGNGWLVQPTGSGTVSVTLRWTPQTKEDVALAVSALAVVVCVVLALPRRRRRSRGRHRAGETAAAAPAGSVSAMADGGTVSSASPGAVTDVDAPELVSPFGDDRPLSPVLATVLAAVCGLAAGVLVPQAIFLEGFLGVGVGVAVALIVPRLRGLLAVAVVGFAGSAVVYTLVRQATQHFPSGAWPMHFEDANELVWIAIVFLGADAVIEVVRRLRR